MAKKPVEMNLEGHVTCSKCENYEFMVNLAETGMYLTCVQCGAVILFSMEEPEGN